MGANYFQRLPKPMPFKTRCTRCVLVFFSDYYTCCRNVTGGNIVGRRTSFQFPSAAHWDDSNKNNSILNLVII